MHSFLVLAFFLCCSFHLCVAKIFSSKEKFTPDLIDLTSNSAELGTGNLPLQRLKAFLKRQRRSATIGSTEKLISHQFDLGNESTHNQALIHWSGNYSHVIFILTRRKSHGDITHSALWRSTNYGVSFTNETHKFDDKAVLKSYFVCPTDKSKVVFVDKFNNSHRVWVSQDEGESYTQHKINFSLDKVEFHPVESDWLLGYDKIDSSLYVSQDLGASWHFMHNGVTKDRYFWYIKGVDTDGNASTVVHMEYRDLDLAPALSFFVKSCYAPTCTPTPFNEHCKKLGPVDLDSLVVQDNYTFAQKTGAREKLYVSYKRGPFVKAKFSGSNMQTDFHVVSSDGGTVAMGVKHINNDDQTDLFFSGVTGEYFTLSLPSVRYFGRKSGDDFVFTVDIHEVKAVEGTFIANTVTSTGQNQTMITNDNGRFWRPLAKPSHDANKRPYPTCVQCTLNLHVAMSQTKSGYYMPGMLSKSTIPGLIISHGSIGRSLIDAPSHVNVYVSNDGGDTWIEVLQKRHLFVVADHGAMIVAVQMIFLKPVRTLRFSNDEGKSWSEHTFSKVPINVDGLLTEPGEYTHKLTLFGHRSYRDSWKLYALDLSPLAQRKCSYPGDFSNWTLTVGNNDEDKCHLGMIQKFERLNSSHCLVNSTYKRYVSKEVCSCTESDYECDFGYVKQMDEMTKSFKCVVANPRIDNVGDAVDDGDGDDEDDNLLRPIGPCVNGTRNVSSGYRRIPGNRCQNDLTDKLPKSKPCSNVAPTTPNTPTAISLKLLNETNDAKVGEELFFSVGGVSNVRWTVIRATEPNKVVYPPPIIKKGGNEMVSLTPKKPGDYKIRASVMENPGISATMFVSFWYPIREVYIYHPPVVEVNTLYNVTAAVDTTFGLPGTSSLLGRVNYMWSAENSITQVMMDNQISVKHSNVQNYELTVTANNKVSYKTTQVQVVVKDYVEILVLPLQSSIPLNESMFTHTWINDLREILSEKMFDGPTAVKMFKDNGVRVGINIHLFVEPRLPLKATLHFSPNEKNNPPRDQLLKAAIVLEHVIGAYQFRVDLPHNVTLIVTEPYVINDNGTVIPLKEASTGGPNAGIIALIVIICVALLVGVVFILRRYASKSRWSNYFLTSNPRNMHIRSSHIVRSRNQDRAPIVNEEEFIDDDLDNMEALSTNQGGTLQFQG